LTNKLVNASVMGTLTKWLGNKTNELYVMSSKKGSRTVHIPEEIDLKLRLIAAEQRVSVTSLIVDALKAWFVGERESQQPTDKKQAGDKDAIRR
jgi:predicted transcriptional regulator